MIVELGANDGLRGVDLKETRANLERIIERLLAGDTKVILAGMKLPPNYGREYTGAFQSLYPELAKAYKIPLMPFFLLGAIGGLFTAWAERRKVEITYAGGAASQRTVWPLFLEPSAIGHSCYLIAQDEKSKSIRSFKVERIKAIKLLEQEYYKVCERAVEALVRIGEPSLFPLIHALKEEDPKVRQIFEEEIKKYGIPLNMPPVKYRR